MRIASLVLVMLLLNSCFQIPDKLQKIKSSGVLKVLILNIPGVYYEGPFGAIGFEYELLKKFADDIGVDLKLVIKNSVPDMLGALSRQQADLAAGRIIINTQRLQQFNFSTSYQSTEQFLVTRSGLKIPRKIRQIEELPIEVVKNSSQENLLQHLRRTVMPKLNWESNKTASVQELLFLMHEKLIDYTISNTQEFAINQQLYPELRKGVSLMQNQSIALALPKSEDLSLLKALNQFIQNYIDTYEISILNERYYGYIESFDYVDVRTFQRHILNRLPKYQPWFEKAGKDQQIDWQLLAAMSYQESHWDEEAISPTGVRGLMMLTQATADYIGINDRLSAFQSIFGGAEYFKQLLNRLPDKIEQPDRNYFALAAYNMGYGHLQDAMKLCRVRGLDNSKWAHLKQVLPLLQRRKWYEQTRYGFARGYEALAYVKNIRRYYRILKLKNNQGMVNDKPVRVLDNTLPAL